MCEKDSCIFCILHTCISVHTSLCWRIRFPRARLYICTFAEVHLCNYACFMCECVSDSANSLSGSIRPAVGGAAAHLASTWWICWEWAEPLDTLQWLHRERRCGHTVSRKEVEKMREVENRRQDRPMEERWEDVGGNEGSHNTCNTQHLKAENRVTCFILESLPVS